MKTLTITLSSLLLVGLVACNNDNKKNEHSTDTVATTVTTPAEPVAEAPSEPVDTAAQRKAWEAYAVPGPMHQMIADMNGTWTTETSMEMTPGEPPVIEKGTVTNKMVLGGRYQESHHKGTMMGQPFEGIGTMGYDNSSKKFNTTWMDNMGTGIMRSEGVYDEANKTITFTGKMVDGGTGKECDIRELYKMVDKDHHEMEMYVTQSGKESKMFSMKITRKGK